MPETPYMIAVRHENGMPLLITSAEIEPAHRPNYPYLVLAAIPYLAQDNGLPAQGELSRVAKLEESLTNALKDCRALHLGHVTHNGIFLVAHYAMRPAPDSVTIPTGFLKKSAIDLNVRKDPDWSWFTASMEPTPLERVAHRNQPLYEVLTQHGNRPELPRPVDFTFFFKSPEGCQAAADKLSADGFRQSQQDIWESDGSYGIELVREMATLPEEMDPLCVQLDKVAEELGGEFDGWACPVKK